MFTLKRKRAATALAISFAAIPAVALAATDAVPGDPLKLGQENRIVDQSTTLSGIGQKNEGVLKVRKEGGPNAGAGAALKVVNEGNGIARGIDINVGSGKPPISVNADAGKASNLNADRLDGRDEEDFLPARIYGNGTTSLVQGHGGGTTVLITALSGLECDDGDIALNAGARAIDLQGDLETNRASDLVAIEPFRSSYTIEFRDNGAPSKFRANIICMDNARPFR